MWQMLNRHISFLKHYLKRKLKSKNYTPDWKWDIVRISSLDVLRIGLHGQYYWFHCTANEKYTRFGTSTLDGV